MADISFVLRSTEREQSLLWRVATFEVADNVLSEVRSAETSSAFPLRGAAAPGKHALWHVFSEAGPEGPGWWRVAPDEVFCAD